MHYVIATLKPWNIAAFERRRSALPGDWHLITERSGLNAEALGAIAPRYVFFPHWSWMVPDDITRNFDCVCFHMTDVPYGRGGSPLQNLIKRGHEETQISALRMGTEADAGPVYLKRPLALEGSAQEIFERFADIAIDMIADIVSGEPEPRPQEGEATIFERRTPDQSEIPEDAGAREIYDHIRMLDAETYPRAYLDRGSIRMEFSDAALYGENVEARVRFRKK